MAIIRKKVLSFGERDIYIECNYKILQNGIFRQQSVWSEHPFFIYHTFLIRCESSGSALMRQRRKVKREAGC